MGGSLIIPLFFSRILILLSENILSQARSSTLHVWPMEKVSLCYIAPTYQLRMSTYLRYFSSWDFSETITFQPLANGMFIYDSQGHSSTPGHHIVCMEGVYDERRSLASGTFNYEYFSLVTSSYCFSVYKIRPEFYF